MKILIIAAILCLGCYSQACLDPNGNTVAWWVQLLFPGSVPGGFAYIDSTFTSSDFTIFQETPDAANTPLTRTLTQINSMNLQSTAWNDENPNGKTSSSKAHSKGVIAYNEGSYLGFLLDHSIPQFPSFNGFKVDTSISEGQEKYGQHAFCLTLDASMVGNLITKILPIRPYIYATNLNNPDAIQNLMDSGRI